MSIFRFLLILLILFLLFIKPNIIFADSLFANVSSNLITGVQLPDGDSLIDLVNSSYKEVKAVKFQYQWRYADQKALDNWIDKARVAGYKVMVSVAKKPTNLPDGEGYEDFSKFMEDLAKHEGSRVMAYEIWNEPNFRGEMEGFGDNSPQSYLKILKAGAEGVRNGNPNAKVISAALAPLTTEYDDEQFFNELNDLGGFSLVDAIGYHANITKNLAPSDSSKEGFQRVKIALKFGKPVWITEFGWARDDAGIDRATQERYIKEAFEMGPKLGNIEAMFVWGFGVSDLDQAGKQKFAQWDVYNPQSNGSFVAKIFTTQDQTTSICGKDSKDLQIPCYKIGLFEDQTLKITKEGARQALENYQTYSKILEDLDKYISDAVKTKARQANENGKNGANACINNTTTTAVKVNASPSTIKKASCTSCKSSEKCQVIENGPSYYCLDKNLTSTQPASCSPACKSNETCALKNTCRVVYRD